MFEGRDLTCIRGDRVVFAGLDFHLEPGAACLVTGPNGSGKSSLLRLMAGLLLPRTGKLSWNGIPVDADPDSFRTELQYVGHLDAVKPALTVGENLEFWSRLRGGAGIEAGLEAFGLTELRELPARFMSAGQRRRLNLARLLTAPARLWLLDEPTVSLDERGRVAVEAVIAAHRAAGGIAVVSTNVPIVLHDPVRLDVGAPEWHPTEWSEPW